MRTAVKAAGPYYKLFQQINYGDPAEGYNPTLTVQGLKSAWIRNMAEASGKNINQLEQQLDAPRRRLRAAGKRVQSTALPFQKAAAAIKPLELRLAAAVAARQQAAAPVQRALLQGARLGLRGTMAAATIAGKAPHATGTWLAARGGQQKDMHKPEKVSDTMLFAYLINTPSYNAPELAADYIPSFARNEHVLAALQNPAQKVLTGLEKTFAIAALTYAIERAVAPSAAAAFADTDANLLVNLVPSALAGKLQAERFPSLRLG